MRMHNSKDLIKPIETPLTLPDTLNGRFGTNRNATPSSLIKADDDLEAIGAWLNLYRDSPQTFRSYRKEVERLYRWCLVDCRKPISSLDVEDITAYWRFMRNPSPAEVWCGPKRPRHHKHWKPFSGPLSDPSRELALTILGRCFSFLTDAGYLRGNPIRLMGKSGRRNVDKRATIERYLPRELWDFLWRFIESKQSNDPKEIAKKERMRFLFALLYLQMPRVSEVVKHSMSSFYKDRGNWWWLIHGKGNKTRKVPVSEEMMKSLERYRLHRNLPATPTPSSHEPLLTSLDGTRAITADMVYRIVKGCVAEAALELEHVDPYEAERLRKTSTHWLRHTGLTHLADSGVDMRFLKATARHESLETTQRYLHIEEDEWHNAMKKKRL